MHAPRKRLVGVTVADEAGVEVDGTAACDQRRKVFDQFLWYATATQKHLRDFAA